MQCRSDVLSTTSSRWLLFRNGIISPVKSLYFCFSYMQARRLRYQQGAKKIIFAACHSGKLRLAFTGPDVISTSPKNVLTSRIDLKVLLLFEFLKKTSLAVGQVKNRIYSPDSKVHQPWAIGHYFLWTPYQGAPLLVPSLSLRGTTSRRTPE